MALDDRAEGVVGNPVESSLGIHPCGEVAREEAVTLQSPWRHEQEDAERRLTEGKAGRLRLGEHAGHQVHAVDIAVVDPAQFFDPLRVIGQLLEPVDPRQVDQLAEVVVPRHAELPRAQDVSRGQVLQLAVWAPELLQPPREVVERDRPGWAIPKE